MPAKPPCPTRDPSGGVVLQFAGVEDGATSMAGSLGALRKALLVQQLFWSCMSNSASLRRYDLRDATLVRPSMKT